MKRALLLGALVAVLGACSLKDYTFDAAEPTDGTSEGGGNDATESGAEADAPRDIATDGIDAMDVMDAIDARDAVDAPDDGMMACDASCGGRCTDLSTDPRNCGSCGNACGSGRFCIGGNCMACPAPKTYCPGVGCIDVSGDPNNCGACGSVCSQTCTNGVCCAAGTIGCSGACVNPSSDNNNCGSCGNPCPSGTMCASGRCMCSGGGVACTNSTGGVSCYDVTSDNNHCGNCTTVCPAGSTCSGSACHCTATGATLCVSGANTYCSDTSSDNNNCGNCFNMCPANAACVGGSCQCAAGFFSCGSSCYSMTDNAHCGSCSLDCTALANATGTCIAAGVCDISSCTPGFQNCDSDPMNGCESSRSNDPNNCGGCGTVCPGPTTGAGTPACVSGVCTVTCPTGWAYDSTMHLCFPPPPKQITPWSTATTTSVVTLRWVLPAGVTNVSLTVSQSRNLSSPMSFNYTGGQTATTLTLARGVWYWSMSSQNGAVYSSPSPVWQFTVSETAATRPGLFGPILDVNGDGVADPAIGAPGMNPISTSNTGAAFVFTGLRTGPPNNPISFAGAPGASMGSAVASAGDCDGDGFGDLIVSQAYSNATWYPGSSSGVNSPRGMALPLTGDYQGGMITLGVGDVDGDGYGDLLLSGGGGHPAVYFGGPAGPGATAADRVTVPIPSGAVPSEYTNFGQNVAAAGDVDADGFADLLIANETLAHQSIVIVYGGSRTLTNTFVYSYSTTATSGNAFGDRMVGAGDLNGDGYSDFAVGAQYDLMGFGSISVFYGGARATGVTLAGTVTGATDTSDYPTSLAMGNVSAADTWSLIAGDGAMNVQVFSTAIGQAFQNTPRQTFNVGIGGGIKLASGGDLNGDGGDDLMIGEPMPLGSDVVAVFLGSSSGVSVPAAGTLAAPGMYPGFGWAVSLSGNAGHP